MSRARYPRTVKFAILPRGRTGRQGEGMAVTSVASGGAREARRLASEVMLAKLTRKLGGLALILLLGFLSIYPLAMLFYGSIHSTPPGEPGVFNLDGYRAM